MCLIINHFITITIMSYGNLQVNYMVTVFIRQLLLFKFLRLLSDIFYMFCLLVSFPTQTPFPGWCKQKLCYSNL